MIYEFNLRHQVEFAETDMAGVVYFAHFFRWMELIEHHFLRSLGCSIYNQIQQEKILWPRVHAECDYLQPLRCEDWVEIRLLVVEKREKLLDYAISFHRLDADGLDGPATLVAQGRLKVVCATIAAPGNKLHSVPIPAAIADQIQVAPTDISTKDN